MAITFTHPYFLSLFLVIPLLVFIHFFTLSYKHGHALRFANFEAISKIRGIDLYSKNIFILVLIIVICVLLILSLAGFTMHRLVSASSSSFVIAIDSSKSMEADDLPPSRISVAKRIAQDFVDSVPKGTRIGIISFSGNSIIETDVTDDRSLIKIAINDLETKAIGGTDLYEAIITSTNLLKPEEAKSVILLSDGQINVGSLVGAIDYANKNDVIVHSIVLGTKEGGQTTYGISKVDEESLKAISYNTLGKFFSVQNEGDLLQSFNEVLNLEMRKVSTNYSSELVLAALVLVVLQYFLINTRYRIFP